MRKDWTLTQEAFDLLLSWLSADRDEAGAIYEQIRARLIKIFINRGCVNSDLLADETINRVTSKLPEIMPAYTGNPIHYFYNVANKVHLESISTRRKKEDQLDPLAHSKHFGISPAQPSTSDEVPFQQLEECLEELPPDSRKLLLEYFGAEKAKAASRRMLAEGAGMNLNKLRIKILRLKRKLQECVMSKRLATS